VGRGGKGKSEECNDECVCVCLGGGNEECTHELLESVTIVPLYWSKGDLGS